MTSMVTNQILLCRSLTNDPERKVSFCHVCIDRNYAPHDLICSRAEPRQGNVQQPVVGAIQTQILFVHFLPGCVEDLNAANGGLDILAKSNSNLAWRCLYGAAYPRIGILEKSVCFKSG